MRIQLSSAEILKAVHQYVGTLGINLSNKAVNIDFVQRQKLGLTADVTITDESDSTRISAGGTLEITDVLPTTPDAPINDLTDDTQSIFS